MPPFSALSAPSRERTVLDVAMSRTIPFHCIRILFGESVPAITIAKTSSDGSTRVHERLVGVRDHVHDGPRLNVATSSPLWSTIEGFDLIVQDNRSAPRERYFFERKAIQRPCIRLRYPITCNWLVVLKQSFFIHYDAYS